MDYGYINRSTDSGTGRSFHTRQIAFPILFTVYHTFEPHSLDLMRFQPTSSRAIGALTNGHVDKDGEPGSSTSLPVAPRTASFAANAEEGLQRRLQGEADDEHCLVALSVRNVFAVPFEITLERKGSESGRCQICRLFYNCELY